MSQFAAPGQYGHLLQQNLDDKNSGSLSGCNKSQIALKDLGENIKKSLLLAHGYIFGQKRGAVKLGGDVVQKDDDKPRHCLHVCLLL